MAANERIYIVTYDIADQKRWRRVFNTMESYGQWLQLSVFQCRLTPRRRVALSARLEQHIKPSEDHVLIIDIGPAEAVEPKVESLGKTFEAAKREVVVI